MRQCIKCRQLNLCPHHNAPLHLEVPSTPMHSIMVDLKGKFKLSPQGHQYALTMIEMLTAYT